MNTSTRWHNLTGILAVTLLFAGCADDATGPYASYEEAKAAPGPTYEPDSGTATSMRLKLLDPSDPDSASGGRHTMHILLFDSRSDRPIRDAAVAIQSRMPAHDHTADDEVDPIHTAHGVYEGTRNHFMSGHWVVEIDVEAKAGTAHFEIDVRV